MERFRPFVLGLALLGCGGARNAASHPFPEARLAGTDAGRERGIRCAYEARFDPERGCSFESWGIPLEVQAENEIGASFVLIGAAFALDGVLVLETNDPKLLAKKSFPVLTTGLGRGPHELAVRMIYRGNGYGVFSYLRGYRFQVQAAERLDASSSTGLSVVVQAFEKGGMATPIEQRPAVRFHVEQLGRSTAP